MFGHEPAFPIDRHVGNSLDADPEIRDEFWSVLAQNGVRAFFCGHSHHLSVVQKQGVYQIDTDEVVAGHLSVAVGKVDSEFAIVRLYETTGSIPEANSDDNVFNSYLNNLRNGDEAYTVVFSSNIKEEDLKWGCFIESIWL